MDVAQHKNSTHSDSRHKRTTRTGEDDREHRRHEERVATAQDADDAEHQRCDRHAVGARRGRGTVARGRSGCVRRQRSGRRRRRSRRDRSRRHRCGRRRCGWRSRCGRRRRRRRRLCIRGQRDTIGGRRCEWVVLLRRRGGDRHEGHLLGSDVSSGGTRRPRGHDASGPRVCDAGCSPRPIGQKRGRPLPLLGRRVGGPCHLPASPSMTRGHPISARPEPSSGG